jgi:hypothetical protein
MNARYVGIGAVTFRIESEPDNLPFSHLVFLCEAISRAPNVPHATGAPEPGRGELSLRTSSTDDWLAIAAVA